MKNAVRTPDALRQVLEGTGGKQTLTILGAACGKRLRSAAEALEQDPHQLVMLLGTAILARLGTASSAERQAQGKLLALWQRSHPGALFLPPWFHSEIQWEYWRLWSRKFSAREFLRLERVLAVFSRRQRRHAVEALRAREVDDALAPFLEIILGKVHTRDAAEDARLRALTDGASRWFRWRRKTDPDPVTAAATRRRQEARRRNAMHLLADVLLARLLATYDIPKPLDLCYFVSGVLDPSAQDTPTPPPPAR